ncbi:MAG: hypothetical protein LBC59_07470 [Chitinispirillales bacterium]|jgi:uncharacterized protein (TIGR02145 family)|nr:hypothetical protein [Chitinispirillales bacterium]
MNMGNGIERALLIAAALVAVSAAPAAAQPWTLNDRRDGQKYKTVKIGDRIWMAENLNYKPKSGSWCYGDKESNCEKYGRLYDFRTARTVCPPGWRIPEAGDWRELLTTAGGAGAAGEKLKANIGWSGCGGKDCNGADEYGFAALPGGMRYHDNHEGDLNRAKDAGECGYWWTGSSPYGSGNYVRICSAYGYVYEDHSDGNENALSVRCVMGLRASCCGN